MNEENSNKSSETKAEREKGFGSKRNTVLLSVVIVLLLAIITAYVIVSNKSELDKFDENMKKETMLSTSSSEKATTDSTTTTTAAALSAPSSDIQKGEYVVFGKYEQDNSLINGKEDIEWIVLEVQDGKAFLLSRYGLDNQPYHDSLFEGTTWETCTLRKWLNEDFYNEAFSDEDKGRILTTTVETKSEKVDAGNDTQDKVFLIDSSTRYASGGCVATEWAKHRGAWYKDDPESDYYNKSHCWLRDPGDSQDKAAISAINGILFSGTEVWKDYAVRPAIWVSIEK